MQTRFIVQAGLLHGALIVGVGLGLRPSATVQRPQVQLAMQLDEPAIEVPEELEMIEPVPLETVPEPEFEETEVAEAPLEEQHSTEATEDAPPLCEPEPHFAVPPRIRPSSDLLVRIRPVARPVPAPASPVQPTTEPSVVPPADAEAEAIAKHNRKPVYPPSALRRSLEADVVLLVDVDAEGVVTAVELLESAGYTQAHKDMNHSAVAAVFLWRYRPAIRNGVAAPARIKVPVQFRLRDSR